MLLDAYVHPSFADGIDPLIAALDWPKARVVAYARAGAGRKAGAFQRHGFRLAATLPQWLTVAGQWDDLAVWVRDG